MILFSENKLYFYFFSPALFLLLFCVPVLLGRLRDGPLGLRELSSPLDLLFFGTAHGATCMRAEL